MARWILAAGLLGTLITAPSTAAEWFFRGTANGWAATAMTSTDGVNFDTCQRFVSGDASGGPRFKIDRYGNWQQSYPAADYGVNANTAYQIRINASTQAVSALPVGRCSGAAMVWAIIAPSGASRTSTASRAAASFAASTAGSGRMSPAKRSKSSRA